MKTLWMYVGMVAIGFFLMVSVAGAAGIGQSAPGFSLQMLRGAGEVSLQNDLKGSPSLLVFWTTWCPSCRREMPTVNKLAKKYQSKGVTFLGINAGWKDSKSRAVSYLEDNGIDDFPMVFDSGSTVTRKFALRGVPTFIVLDAEGVIRHQGFSMSQELLTTLDSLAEGEG